VKIIIQEETTNKTVTLTINASKFTAQTAVKMMNSFLEHQKNKSKNPKIYKGKQRFKNLMKSGEKLTNIEVTDENMKPFDRIARKYGIDYSLKKDNSQEPPKYYVFFKARDTDVLTAAFKEFTHRQMTKSTKTPIKQKLRDYAQKTLEDMQERSREKKKTREAEL